MRVRLFALLMLLTLGFAGCKNVRSEFAGTAEEEDFTEGFLALLYGAATATGCPDATVISGILNNNVTTGPCVRITGTVFVPSGYTLTIPAGATVYAENAAALFIMNGGKLNAIGTQALPIVFTSAQPVGTRRSGDWGGITLLGNAPNNRAARNSEGAFPQIYGGPSSTSTTDNSGRLSYVRIEYGGYAQAAGSELNSLSLYTVGSGTTLDHIQSHMGKDDGFEFFGGTVNAKFLMSTGTADDEFDIDEGYQGNLQFLIGVRYPVNAVTSGAEDQHFFEFNGAANGTTPSGGATTALSSANVANFTGIGSFGSAPNGTAANLDELLGFRNGMTGTATHGILYGFGTSTTVNAGDGDLSCQVNPASGTMSLINTLADTGTNVTVPGTCTFSTTNTLNFQPITTIPTQSGTSANFTPVGAAAAAAPALSGVSGFSSGFFTNNTQYGGIIVGQDWTTGWTRYTVE